MCAVVAQQTGEVLLAPQHPQRLKMPTLLETSKTAGTKPARAPPAGNLGLLHTSENCYKLLGLLQAVPASIACWVPATARACYTKFIQQAQSLLEPSQQATKNLEQAWQLAVPCGKKKASARMSQNFIYGNRTQDY